MSIREQMGTDVLAARQPLVSLTSATKGATVLESGTMFVLNKADGITVTLPASADLGTYFDFVVGTTVTSNSYKIITAVGTELLVGQALNCDTDTGNATLVFPGLVGSSYISIIMNGSTTGGLKGDSVRFTKLNATTWLCNGRFNGTGTVATPYSAS